MRTESITNIYDSIDEVLKQNLVKLRRNIDISNVANILQLSEFKKLEKQLVDSNSPQSRVTVMLLKDLNLLLSFISVVRESDIELHVQCERQFLNLAHAFNRMNYSRWETFQHIYLSSMKQKSALACQKLEKCWIHCIPNWRCFQFRPW